MQKKGTAQRNRSQAVSSYKKQAGLFILKRLKLLFVSKNEGGKMEDKTQLKQTIENLFSSQKLAVLATQNEGQPYCNLVAFVAEDGIKNLLFATEKNTRKYQNLLSDPRVSMLVENSQNELADFQKASVVTILGSAFEISKNERDSVKKIYLSRHPNLENFVESSDCALMRVKVKSYIVVSRFREVSSFHF